MTETDTLPELRDAMTAAELTAHCRAITKRLGAAADVYISADADEARLSIYPYGICNRDDYQFLRAPTWPDILRAGHDFAASHRTIARERRIRKMALAIMDLKDQHGRVDVDMLARGEFSRAEVLALHEAACDRAGDIAGGAPFRVEGV